MQVKLTKELILTEKEAERISYYLCLLVDFLYCPEKPKQTEEFYELDNLKDELRELLFPEEY